MDNKNKRLMLIREAIQTGDISSQQQLLEQLRESGFEVTQATLSRDLKYLNVGKIADGEKGYQYILSDDYDSAADRNEDAAVPADAFLGIEFSGNLGIIRTLPAFAPSIALTVDRLNIYGIMGTIAGDDNILVVLREGIRPLDVLNTLALKLPEIKDKL